jgi:hypothetical protein
MKLSCVLAGPVIVAGVAMLVIEPRSHRGGGGVLLQ